MRSFHLGAAVLLAFSTLSIVSADPFNREILPRDPLDLLPRQTTKPTAGVGDAIVGDSTPTSTADSSATGKDSKQSGNNKSTKKTKTTKVNIPVDAVAGSIQMVTPNVYDAYPIYKIGDTVTFEWNYTDVLVSPSAINVVAFCSQAAQDFTITGNASAGMTRIYWDTGKYQSTATDKLPVATYTLNIFDASGSKNDVGQPGYLGPFSGLQFGMYTPKEYKPLSEFVCPTCDPNIASTLNKYTLRMMIGMGILAATSFTWFLAGIHL
ncbi:hypothetical protein BDD12DRAFT_321799 [Trichophaea hybrida]|nr:hypothetical protein BDD12DRAFT_321799 [Trichophaea hybrida]